jgi:two-component system cell cycle sensor histidine kinase/response regulator CckA
VDRSIDLDVQIADNLQLARGDSTLMRQVLLNLGLNARDAIRSARKAGREQAGTIRFEVQERDVLEGELGSSPDAHAGRFVVVSVSDDGCGMSGETLSRVFEPFFTTKAMGAGTGLGLAVVHGILRQHAGWIEVLSALGAGTTFACYLPVTTEAAVASPSSDREPLAAAPGGCVLMVDDDDLVRRTARRLLEDAGYEVREAVDGPSALDRYQGEREEIDVVLLDLSMPGMSGDEVLRELLIMDPLARVVLWSGYSKSEAASSLAETGARAFLSKPFDARGLLGVIARVIEE